LPGSGNLFSNIAFATYLLFVVQDLHLDPLLIGVVFGLGNLGSLVGTVTADRIGRRFGVGPTIVGTAFLFGPAGLLVPLATPALAVPLLIAASALGGFSGVVYNITQVSFRQAITPAPMQGRMNATMRFIVWGTIPVGSLLGGVLGTLIGLHATLWVAAIGMAFPWLFVALSPVRGIRTIPAGPEIEAADIA
jgi:MFS family permease